MDDPSASWSACDAASPDAVADRAIGDVAARDRMFVWLCQDRLLSRPGPAARLAAVLAAGADPRRWPDVVGAAVPDEDTPFHAICAHGAPAAIIGTCLAAGCPVDGRGPSGRTPLLAAAAKGWMAAGAITALLEHGADATATGRDGRPAAALLPTPLECIGDRDGSATAALLDDFGRHGAFAAPGSAAAVYRAIVRSPLSAHMGVFLPILTRHGWTPDDDADDGRALLDAFRGMDAMDVVADLLAAGAPIPDAAVHDGRRLAKVIQAAGRVSIHDPVRDRRAILRHGRALVAAWAIVGGRAMTSRAYGDALSWCHRGGPRCACGTDAGAPETDVPPAADADARACWCVDRTMHGVGFPEFLADGDVAWAAAQAARRPRAAWAMPLLAALGRFRD